MTSTLPPERIPITGRKLVVVEGADEEHLLGALMAHMGVTGIEIHNVRGKDNFRNRLRALVQAPDFAEVKSLAIIRDADADAASALQSLRDSLIAVSLPAPTASLQLAGTNPGVVVLILPHGQGSGTLEDVCLASVASDPVMPCLDEYLKCIQGQVLEGPNNLSKARLQAFLASRRRPGLRLGEAAHQGYWQWEHEAFGPLKQLLRMI